VLEHNVERLNDDHANAAYLATALSEIKEIQVEHNSLQTNMLFIRVQHKYPELVSYLQTKGIIFPKQPNKQGLIRLVTHLDISRADAQKVVQEIEPFYRSAAA